LLERLVNLFTVTIVTGSITVLQLKTQVLADIGGHWQSYTEYATSVRRMEDLGKGEVLTNTDLDRFVNNI